jgi:hypothetical protein
VAVCKILVCCASRTLPSLPKEILGGEGMREIAKKLVEWLSLDTEKGVAGVEYAVIVGLVIAGLLTWYLKWRYP